MCSCAYRRDIPCPPDVVARSRLRRQDGTTIPGTDLTEHHIGRPWQRWSRHSQRRPVEIRRRRLGELHRAQSRSLRGGCAGASCVSSATLVLPSTIARDIEQCARHTDETGGVVLAGIARTPDGLRLLGRNSTGLRSTRTTGGVHALFRSDQRDMSRRWHGRRRSAPCPSGCTLTRIVCRAVAKRVRHGGRESAPRAVPCAVGAEVYASLIASPAGSWFRFSGSRRG